jgi:nitrogen regulatory protein P-II 1
MSFSGGQNGKEECNFESQASRLTSERNLSRKSRVHNMKRIEAIIQPHKLEDTKEALKGIGVDGMTITEVRGHGRQKGHTEVYRGMEYKVDLLPKVKIEMVVPDSRADEVIRTLVAAARTGKIGDGKIFVFEVAEAIRIRNDDRGDAAL